VADNQYPGVLRSSRRLVHELRTRAARKLRAALVLSEPRPAGPGAGRESRLWYAAGVGSDARVAYKDR